MKKRKIVAMALSVMMAVSAIPASTGAIASTPDTIQPHSIPEVGNQFYVEGVSAPTQTDLDLTGNSMTTTAPVGSNKHENWYHASGVIFGVKPTEEETWFRSASADGEKDPYLFFTVLALADQKVATYSSDGELVEDHFATFWTSDYFCGNKSRGDSGNPRVCDETAMMYYSEDNGLTWKSVLVTGGDGIYRLNLADVKRGDVLIYIPMEEFFYYGGYNGAAGTDLPCGYGVSGYKKGYTNFGHGTEILKQESGERGIDLHSLVLSCHGADTVSGTPGAASAVTATDLRLVYQVTDETKTVKNGDDYAVELYACEPAGVTDATVKAKIGEREETLRGTATGEGRTKYVLEGLTEQNMGEVVTFTWSSQTLGVELVARDKVKKAGSLQTLPSELTLSNTNTGDSPLWGGNAVWAGDSLVYAARDKTADGWAGRIATTYSMSYENNAIGGRQISSFAGRGNAPLICNQIDKQINSLTAKERETVEYVILNGGINDINRDGVQIGAMTDDFDGFDVRTYAGALEYTFSVARRAYPNATVGFIIPFKMPLAVQAGPAKCRDDALMRQYVDLTVAICEKWGVPYLNMYDDSAFNDLIDTDNPDTQYMDKNDMLHLNKNGYVLTAPYVAAWMETLEKQYIYYDQVLDGMSVSLTDGAEVTVWTKNIPEATDAKMTVSVAGGTPIELQGVKEKGRIGYAYKVEFWQLGDELSFSWSSDEWTDEAAAQVRKTASVNVREYCEYIISSSGNEKLVSLAKALLQYGAELQKAKGYKTDALCNAGIEALPPIGWDTVTAPYNNPNEKVFKGVELIGSPASVLKLTVETPNSEVTSVAYRVDGSREYEQREYEVVPIVDGKVEIPMAPHELGRTVMVRLLDKDGAWKENYKISGLHCLKSVGATDPLAASLAQYVICADNYLYAK